MRYAKPVGRDILSEAQTVATDTVKNAAKRKLDEIASKIGISGNGVKRNRKTKPKLKRKQSTSIKPKSKKKKSSKRKKTPKTKRRSEREFHDIFK